MNKKIFSLLLLCIFLMVTALSGCGQATETTSAPAGESAAEAGPVIIGITDMAGETHEVDLSSLPAVTGNGGFIKSSGTIVGPVEITGPKLTDVLAEAGGLQVDQALEITASDGYQMIFSYAQTTGQVLAYDNEGQALQMGNLEAIIALSSSDETALEAPPRIAFIGDCISDGHYWIKDIASMKFTTAPEEWTVKISGVVDAYIDRSTFESLATCPDTPHPAQVWEKTNKKGETSTFEGVPLWVLIAMADDDTDDTHYTFNDALSREGYTIQVIAKDGYTAELKSQDVAHNESIFLAYVRDGEPLGEDGPLQLTGSGLTDSKSNVKQVAEIKIVLP